MRNVICVITAVALSVGAGTAAWADEATKDSERSTSAEQVLDIVGSVLRIALSDETPRANTAVEEEVEIELGTADEVEVAIEENTEESEPADNDSEEKPAKAEGKQKDKQEKEKAKGKEEDKEKPAENAPDENFLGLITRPATDTLQAQFPELMSEGQGLVITKVEAGSPAQKAGLKQHDILLTYDGEKITSAGQFRKLVLADEPDSSVKLGIIRAAKSETLEVPLGKRPSKRKLIAGKKFVLVGPDGAEINADGSSLFDQLSKLNNELSGELAKEGIVIDRPGIRFPGGRIRWQMKTELGDKLKAKHRNRSITLTTKDGKQFELSASLSNGEGESKEYNFQGTLDEIREKIKELPEDVQAELAPALDEAGDVKRADNKQTMRFRFQPRIHGEDRGVRIMLTRPDKEGGMRVIELDRPIELPDTEVIKMQVLKIKELQQELQELGPVIRQKVEETIKNIEIPQIDVEVDRSTL